MLGTVKIDKLYFGIDKIAPESIIMIDEVIQKYYENVITSNEPQKYKKLYRSVTPTKQLRKNYNGFNHNLQMIPLEQFLLFLKELKSVAGQDLDIYEIHLAKDILLEENTSNYLETIRNHEYMNGYVASSKEANSPSTVYVSKRKGLDSNRKQKLLIKFYDKAEELMSKHPANRVLPLKEPVLNIDIPMGYAKGSNTEGILLYQMNLLRCELELRENNLPYTTIGQIIEAIEKGRFQDTVESKFIETMKTTVFIESKTTSCRTLKEIAINLMRKSKRDYKILFRNAGMSREYNYFKKAKEVVTRENDLNFEELRRKLLNEQSKYSP